MKTHWKAILATLGVILPSLFTYLASRSESTEAKVRAEVAYVTMQEAVKELQAASYEQAIQLAEMRGQLRAERRSKSETAVAPKPGSPAAPVVAAPPDGDGIPDQQKAVHLKAPTFNEAVQSYKAKK